MKEGLHLFHETSYQTTKAVFILPIVCENVLKKEAWGDVKAGTRHPAPLDLCSRPKHTQRDPSAFTVSTQEVI